MRRRRARAQFLDCAAEFGQLRRYHAQARELVAQSGTRCLELSGEGVDPLGRSLLQRTELGEIGVHAVDPVTGAVDAPVRGRGKQERNGSERHGRRVAAPAGSARSAFDGEAFDIC